MSTDTILRAADPLRDDDHDLVPNGAMATRVRAGAQREGDAPRTAPRRGRLALAGGLAVALAAAAVAVGLPGSGSSPTRPADARAALVSAAEKTATFTSGKITWRVAQDDVKLGSVLDTTTALRYEGEDFDSTMTSSALPGQTGGARTVGGRTWRLRDGQWKPVELPAGLGSPSEQFAQQLGLASDLAQAAQRADGVTATPDGGDDATRYAATLDAAAVPVRFNDTWTGAVQLDATVGGDGTVRAVSLRGTDVNGGTMTIAVTFDELGQPQGIVAP
ncbi:hypothetical protein [Baekduia sp. Peel2402]|uniref:hypothetical protein n=1 Tax=Baekduia sp. Peel2402 TaxID=3458296 RepID=UPI00403EDFAE